MAYTSTSARSNRRHDIQRSKGLDTMDINPSLQILGSFDKGIRQESTKRVKPFIVCCADCSEPLSSVVDLTQRKECVYTRHSDLWHATNGVLTSLPAKLAKIRMRFKTLSDGRHKQNSVFRHPPTRTG